MELLGDGYDYIWSFWYWLPNCFPFRVCQLTLPPALSERLSGLDILKYVKLRDLFRVVCRIIVAKKVKEEKQGG